ncbi:anti-sigma factor [Actinomycetospora callitridis]|uniref:anti-sigma factor n=1 Tax=Actinomycetospora callitridis TaxID=913944 RepID=UPI002366A60F|nr:anti-sigma factor [Actinomycetospora callitridis]MDD7918821.1 anti-sigma factor [Actinomycetospora callitridis]
MPHPDRERLTLVALGEQPVVDALSTHLDQCAQCRSEVTAMRDTVALAREAGPAPLEAPPDHVWSSIAAELALGADPAPGPVRPIRPSRRRRALVVGALAAAAALVAAVAIAVAGPFTEDPPATEQIASASLSAFAAGPPGATGKVSVVEAGGERRIEVSATMPPAPEQGYYEVWLLDERTNSMVAIGALGENGHGSFTMPAGLDMTGYSVVDVSAERYDGDPAHASSVLRGTLSS